MGENRMSSLPAAVDVGNLVEMLDAFDVEWGKLGSPELSTSSSLIVCEMLSNLSRVVAFLSLLAFSSSIVSAEENLPASWDDFLDFHVESGAFGTFQGEGVTKGMWEGIAEGQAYTGVYTLEPAEGGRSIRSSHRMETESGEVISIGTGIQYWDETTKSVLSSYSGFDQGKVFTGSSTLKTFDPENNLIEWVYTETSRGKTTQYLQRIQQSSENEKTQGSSKVEGGPSWDETLTRVGTFRMKLRVRPLLRRKR